MENPSDHPSLATIPVLDAGDQGPAGLAEQEVARLKDLAVIGHRAHGRWILAMGDRIARRWLVKTQNPFLDQIDRVAQAAGEPGVIALNLSYEFACTAGVAKTAAGLPKLKRTLDWPVGGLGRAVIVARHAGPAGDYLDITWPGYIGMLSGLKPGAFAVTLNQAPMRDGYRMMSLDWVAARRRWWGQRGLPPHHLIRRVFETCRTFADAKKALAETPIAMPVFFTLAGAAEGEACVIERSETGFDLHEGLDACVSNHWIKHEVGGHLRGWDPIGRRHAMQAAIRDEAMSPLDWVQPPILNVDTRYACELSPAEGTLVLQGLDPAGPQGKTLPKPTTKVLSL